MSNTSTQSIVRDHRILYAIFLVIMIFPFVAPFNLPMEISDPTKSAYETVSNLPEGSVILLSVDFRTMSWSEIGVGAASVLQQLYDMPVKFVAISTIPEGPMLFDRILGMVDQGDKTYGEDWVNVGYVSGRESAAAGLAEDFKSVVKTDYRGVSLDELELTKDITGAEDFDLILTFEDESTPWLLYWAVPFDIPIVLSGQALLVPGWLPWYQEGTLKGYLGGIRGYAEYQTLMGVAGEPVRFMNAINISFLFIILVMFLGNVQYWTSKERSRGGR